MTEASIKVALISMPWASVWIPSIQLSVLRQCLGGVAHADTFEFYVDFATQVSLRLYTTLAESLGFAEEWIFGAGYFEREGLRYDDDPSSKFPSLGLGPPEQQPALLRTLAEVADDFIERLANEHPWGSYDVIAFSLSISQTAASMALAQRIRARHPHVRIVFGGSSCAGPASEAILKICPHVDVVAHGEAEASFAELVRRLVGGSPLTDLPGISYREAGGLKTTAAGPLSFFERRVEPPNFDAYFERVARFGLSGSEQIVLPFESSRGCWWGQKSQCVFCGLHETMKWRARDPDDVLEELDYLHARHGVRRFFATDLIMPDSYYETLLPKLAGGGRDYHFYYELKANVSRSRMRLLSDAGVRLIQPGLESLSTSVLKLIKKGTTAAQNVALLKWSQELGMKVSWNIIIGVPGEDPAENDLAAQRVKWLRHLPPPFVVEFELTRFSPAFREPERFGLTKVKPVALYRFVFPVGEKILADLVYRFEYESATFAGRPQWMVPGAPPYAASLTDSIDDWRAAYERGAALEISTMADGSGVIVDRRFLESKPRTLLLSPAQKDLYDFIDAPVSMHNVAQRFAAEFPDAAKRLGGAERIHACLSAWAEDGLVFREADRVLSLATCTPAQDVGRAANGALQAALAE